MEKKKISSVQTAVAKSKTSFPIKVPAVPKRLRDVLVVIDPGHGGKDPGASGARKTLEKHVVLNISKRLKTIIDAQPGMKAVLTRKGIIILACGSDYGSHVNVMLIFL